MNNKYKGPKLQKWLNKGKNLKSRGKFREVISCYDRVLKIEPGHITAWYNKGNTLIALGRYRKATICYDRVTGIMPKDADAWYNKGYALDALGKYKEALACYGQAIKIKPKDAGIWNNKGIALYFLGRCQKAIICYDQAIKINPKHARAWNNKGKALDALGRFQQALFCYNRTIELDPHNVNAWYNKNRQHGNKAQLRSLKNASVLLILPCNAAACIGDYFQAESYSKNEWNTWREADFCLSEYRNKGIVAFAALDSSTLETEPNGSKGAIVFEKEMHRVKNPTGKDWGAPNWRWFRPTATGNCEYLKMLTESLVKGIRRVEKMGFSQVFALVNPRGYFLSLATAVDKCRLLDKWILFRVPSHPRYLIPAVRQITPFVRVVFEKKFFIKIRSNVSIQSQVPTGEPCLQVIDYMNWAVYRVFAKREMRYFNFVKDKISFVWDIYDTAKYPKNFYSKSNELDVKKISLL